MSTDREQPLNSALSRVCAGALTSSVASPDFGAMVPPYLYYLTIFFPQALSPNIGSPAPHSISHWRKRSWDLIILLRLAGLDPTPLILHLLFFLPEPSYVKRPTCTCGGCPPLPCLSLQVPWMQCGHSCPLRRTGTPPHLPREWPWAWRQVSTRVWPCRSRVC